MKKIENNFTVTGFLGKDAEIREFTNSSVARFPLAVSRQERNAEETNRISAFRILRLGVKTRILGHSTN